MKKFLKFILDSFNTKNYKWIKSEYLFRKTANFVTKSDKEYYVCFDEISDNIFNIFFYYKKDDKEIIKLIKNADNFEVFSNVKFVILDFIENNRESIEFIGFSSFEEERNDLYSMFLKELAKYNFECYIKRKNKMIYYFCKDINIPEMIINTYEEKFISQDKKNKKY